MNTKNLVLPMGAADASEGLICIDENITANRKVDVAKSCSYKESDFVYINYSEQQPGEGFWSVAPGCGDISEGMVWVAVIRKIEDKPV